MGGYRMVVEPSGQLMPPFANIEACADLRERFELNPYDVIVTTYPKCGTSWLQQIVCLLIHGSDFRGDTMADAAWLEAEASMAANGMQLKEKNRTVDELLALPAPGENQSSLRAWKTHSPIGTVPWKGGFERAKEVGAKLVNVSRNPKDTCVSKYHHTMKLPFLGYNGPFEEFSKMFLEGRGSHNSFWDWHKDWWLAKEANPETILWLHYEDMKKDLEKEIRKVSEFLKLDRTDEELEKVTERCTFTSMKKESDDRNDFASKKNHFRSGKSGGWSEMMPPEIIQAFDEKTEEMTTECGLSFLDKT